MNCLFVILILYYAALLFAIGFLIIPLILYFYIYGDITTQLIEWASMLTDFMSSLINTETKLDKVKKYMAALNILCPKMCSLRGGDFRNQFSVFGLYVMPTHG